MLVPNELKQILDLQNKISFSEFMHYALYSPVSGYYTTKDDILGKSGDFITAPELSELFGQCLAESLQSIIIKNPKAVILEIGAGTGKLAIDILCYLAQNQALPDKYYILEVSGSLKKRQYDTIHAKCAELLDRVVWLDKLPEAPITGVILANEVLDAMPCERIMKKHDIVYQSFITRFADTLQEEFITTSKSEILKYAKFLPDIITGYVTEFNAWLAPWLQSISDILKQGAVYIIDYGFSRSEYLHPDRYTGTLMCHYKQHAHSNPFIHIGQQDITAHVEFTKVAEDAAHANFDVTGFTTQAAFLLECGILDKLSNISDTKKTIAATQAVKTLLQPQEMGELFKIMLLTKNYDSKILGFNLQNKLGTL